jgi:hypothetical protein
MDAVYERRQRSDTPGHHATAERQKCDAANQKRGAKGIQSHELTIDRPSLAMSPARFLAEAVKPLIAFLRVI